MYQLHSLLGDLYYHVFGAAVALDNVLVAAAFGADVALENVFCAAVLLRMCLVLQLL